MLDALVMTAALALPSADRIPQPSRHANSAAVSFLRCVIRHESGMTRHPAKAENPRSSASGLFQMIDGTWRHYAAHVPGARKYHHASHAPASVQWDVGLLAVKWHGRGNWSGTGCPGS